MRVSAIAQTPPPVVRSTATVSEAVRIMQNARGGATVVLDDGLVVGILTERDVMLRVVAACKDAETTLVREVMTSPVETAKVDTHAISALELMVSRHFRHLPVMNEENQLAGLISMRNILLNHMDALIDEGETSPVKKGGDD